MEPDFSGYATKAGLKCSDGRTILPDAFRDQHNARVPLVWQHGHSEVSNVLGHAILEKREDGMFAHAYFNNTPAAKHAKELVKHGDITMMSIWANNLIERTKMVMHGVIKEVSLVLSGANPGALIDPVSIRHSDGEIEELDDEARIFTGLEFELSHSEDVTDEVADGDDDNNANDNDDTSDSEEIQHDAADPTVEEVYNSMTEEQKSVTQYLVAEAVDEVNASNAAAHGDTQEGNNMSNVFDQDSPAKKKHIIQHSDMLGIIEEAKDSGSIKKAVEAYALQHGIEDIGELFPDAKTLSNAPELFGRRTEWVSTLLGAIRKSPFARVKSLWADITEDEARARGYITGTLKKEEFFPIAKRITSPTTIYKKQALDRDDVVDITDFDVIAWLKAEMRLMLDEEIARAILVGDGRDISSDDKINEQCVRPIASDHELFTTVLNVNLGDSNSSIQEVVDSIVENRHKYRGTGTPMLFIAETYIGKFLLLKDTMGRRIYRTLDELAAELRVSQIVPVEVLEDYTDIVAIMVNPYDYNVGADKGGQVNMFDDFDIDYNKHKYLIETRISGALVKLKAAMVIKKTANNSVLAVPTAPTFDPESGEVTITNTTGVVYKDGAGTTINAGGSPYTVASGDSYTVNATPSSGYHFSTSDDDTWTFTAL